MVVTASLWGPAALLMAPAALLIAPAAQAMPGGANAPPDFPGYAPVDYRSLLHDAFAFLELFTPDLRVVFKKGSDYDLVEAFPLQILVAHHTTPDLQWGLLTVAELQYQTFAQITRGNLALRNTVGLGPYGLGGYVEVGGQYGEDGGAAILGVGLMVLRLEAFGVSVGYRVDLAPDLARHTLGLSVDFPLKWFVDPGEKPRRHRRRGED